MALSTQPYKGARDFYPEDKQVQDYLFEVIRTVAKSYGYAEYDAPILEPMELYKAKTGDEIVNEQTYSFTDRGGREVTIRPEMTPTVSRMVAAKRQELAYPLRWFSIPNLWRYERPQRGRLREHWQLNVDIFGESGLPADHEIISLANEVLKAFGASEHMYQIKINSRELVNQLLSNYLELEDSQAHALTKLIDHMHKMDQDKVRAQIEEICVGMHVDIPGKIASLLEITNLNDLPDEVKDHNSVQRLRDLLQLLEDNDVGNAVFDITLMRGFDYYTDIVFEIFDTDPDNNRSMFGGGRYDGLVGLFGVEPVPTVGFGMGDVTLANFLSSNQLLPQFKTPTDLTLILVGDVYKQSIELAKTLRDRGLRVSIDATNRKVDKKIKNSEKQGVQHVLFIGETELQQKVYPLKNLASGNEQKLAIEDVASNVLEHRNHRQ